MREWPKQRRRAALRSQRVWPRYIEPQGSAPGAWARAAAVLLPLVVLAVAVGLAAVTEQICRLWR